ncbi:hypothetical protein A9Q84_21635 [Halobacteriovorax marinus]|uniref:Uncharacterized protein n=1 Tax=Halobacteriovorax marinus TaxID=97084 RepID=A0A1Y5F1V5_9BACT|nr:hypothetical protein A9Q84_21635 [Halobacteriovorax marinus]
MAANKKINSIVENENGQAIFEFVVFLPFIIFLFTVLVNLSNSINGSINQQKALRGYFYRILEHDSKAPNRIDIDYLSSQGRNIIAPVSLGWAKKRVGDAQSFGTCYKFLSLFGSSDEECEESLSGENSSNFVKVFTFYGVCGSTYLKSSGGFYEESHFLKMGNFASSLGSDHCVQQ